MHGISLLEYLSINGYRESCSDLRAQQPGGHCSLITGLPVSGCWSNVVIKLSQQQIQGPLHRPHTSICCTINTDIDSYG